MAATAERFSEHPLARAIVKKAAEGGLAMGEPAEFRYLSGQGIVCEVEGRRTLVGTRALVAKESIPAPADGNGSQRSSEVLVATGGKILWSIRIADVLRAEAPPQ